MHYTNHSHEASIIPLQWAAYAQTPAVFDSTLALRTGADERGMRR